MRIGEFTAPIVGRICMDQLAVDITDAPGTAVGDIATLVDNRKDSRISATRIAEPYGKPLAHCDKRMTKKETAGTLP